MCNGGLLSALAAVPTVCNSYCVYYTCSASRSSRCRKWHRLCTGERQKIPSLSYSAMTICSLTFVLLFTSYQQLPEHHEVLD